MSTLDDRGDADWPASLEAAMGAIVDVEALRAAGPGLLAAASNFWQTAMAGPHLEPRVKELVLIGIHGSVATFNTDAVARHIERALAVGASPAEIIDVLTTIVALANHALYVTMPILEEELVAAQLRPTDLDGLSAEYEAAKQEFIRARGFWNSDRDLLAQLLPDYYEALDAISTASWVDGPLSAKERAFVCIGIDSTVTHTYEPGLRRHIRNAIKAGASAGELLEVIQLTGMIGLESYMLGARLLFSNRR